MNTFEMDLKRALFSKGFLIGLIIEILILDKSGFASDFYLLCMPVVVAFPYATAWLNDYHSGYIKLYLYRTGVKAYIVGKFIVAALSGGILLTLSILVAQWIKGVSLLYHEATFPSEMSEMAEKTFHSTTLQAAQMALDAGVKRLLVGHYSSRFPSVDFYLDQLRSVFPDSDLAYDGDKVEIPFF